MRPTVLIVDDDRMQRRVLARLAERAGFHALEAEDGIDALKVVGRVAPDLVVTDLSMPRMSGPRLVFTMRTHPELVEVPIMVVTGAEDREVKIELLRSGADDFLSKPVDPEEFQVRLRALARKRKLHVQYKDVSLRLDEATQRLEERNQELERLTHGLVSALEAANELNDSDTGNHIRRVCAFASLLGRLHGARESFVDAVYRYAGLHDVGKVGIRDAILKKPGKLTRDEFEEMKAHTTIGARLLSEAGLPPIACNIAEAHHERWDGSGYPHGRKGEEIPLEARLVSVADVFDALVNKRCYKPAFTFERAREIMVQDAGLGLDPNLVRLFFTETDQVIRITKRLADGEGISTVH